MAKPSSELINELEFYKTIELPELIRLKIRPNYVYSRSGFGALVLFSIFGLMGIAGFLAGLSWNLFVPLSVLGFIVYAEFFSHKVTVDKGILTSEKYFLFKKKIPLSEIKKATYKSVTGADLFLFPKNTAKWKKTAINTKAFHWSDIQILKALLENVTGKKV